jgi:hypothetical protein
MSASAHVWTEDGYFGSFTRWFVFFVRVTTLKESRFYRSQEATTTGRFMARVLERCAMSSSAHFWTEEGPFRLFTRWFVFFC